MNNVLYLYTFVFVSVCLHFNSLSLGIRLILVVRDVFFPSTKLFEISIIPWIWHGANANLIPTKARPSITNYDTVKHFDVFSAGIQWHTILHRSSRDAFLTGKKHDGIRGSLLSPLFLFYRYPRHGIIYRELRFLPSFLSDIFNNGILHAIFLYTALDFLYGHIRDPHCYRRNRASANTWCRSP